MSAKVQEAVLPEALYAIEHLKQIMGWSSHAWRTAKRTGLRVRTAGKRKYVIGRDVISWLESLDDGGE